MKAPWTQEDAEVLQKLRLAAKLETTRFAIENSISHAQLLQLENGGDSCFYSPAIKANTGFKLIEKLKKRIDEATNASITQNETDARPYR